MSAETNAVLLRRLDWRFLLPDPELRRVGYVGPGNTLLARALDRHAAAVARVAGADAPACKPARRPDSSQFDLLVAESAGGTAVSHASRQLKPGGWIYWELGPFDAWRPRRPGGLAASGLHAVATHWHYRGFENCRWIVELDRPDSVATLLSRKFPGSSGTVVASFARWITQSALLRRLMATSVIAQRGGS